jgi:hypothetical protein
MNKTIIVTESQYRRIVGRVINEQMTAVEVLGSLPETGQDVVGLDKMQIAGSTDYTKSVNNLFYWAKKQPQGSLPNYKALIWKLHKAMSGAGTIESDIKTVLKSLQNINQLTTLINQWSIVTKSKDSLHTWLKGDVDDNTIWHSLGSWKSKYLKHKEGSGYDKLTA